MGISIPRSLKERIDHSRGDIPRSKFISKILEATFDRKKEVNVESKNQVGESRSQPIAPITDSLPLGVNRGDTSG